MKGLAQATIVGRIGTLESKTVGENHALLVEMSVAVDNYRYPNKPDWHSVKVWGKLAERLCSLPQPGLQVGETICVVGRMEYERWERDGTEQRKAVIVASEVTLLGFRAKPEQQVPQQAPQQVQQAPQQAPQQGFQQVPQQVPQQGYQQGYQQVPQHPQVPQQGYPQGVQPAPQGQYPQGVQPAPQGYQQPQPQGQPWDGSNLDEIPF